MVVEVDQVGPVAQHARRAAVDVAAVEEDHGALRDVLGRGLDQVGKRQPAVLARHGQVLGGDEHRHLLAQGREQPLHAHQRPQRVAVGVLVGGQHEAAVAADALHDLLSRGRGAERLVQDVHERSISSISASTRIARSVVSS